MNGLIDMPRNSQHTPLLAIPLRRFLEAVPRSWKRLKFDEALRTRGDISSLASLVERRHGVAREIAEQQLEAMQHNFFANNYY
jgi:hypothetical protein